MKINFHLHFLGQCAQAFKFYQSILGGEVELLTYGNSPANDQVPSALVDKIVHGSFRFNHVEIVGADVTAEHYQPPQGFQLLLQIESEEKLQRVFNAIAQKGTITMPLQQTFWSSCYGIVTDEYGITWELNYTPE